MPITKARESPWFFQRSLNLAQAINLALFPCTYAETIVTQSFRAAKRLQWNVVGAGGLYKGNALCETPCNKGSWCEPIGVVFKALLEPKSGLPIDLPKLFEWLFGERRSVYRLELWSEEQKRQWTQTGMRVRAPEPLLSIKALWYSKYEFKRQSHRHWGELFERLNWAYQ